MATSSLSWLSCKEYMSHRSVLFSTPWKELITKTHSFQEDRLHEVGDSKSHMKLTFCGSDRKFNISTKFTQNHPPLPSPSFSRSWICQRSGSYSSSTTPKSPAHTRSFRVPFPISKKACPCLLLSSLQYQQFSISKQSFIMRSSPCQANRPRITVPWVNSQASRLV